MTAAHAQSHTLAPPYLTHPSAASSAPLIAALAAYLVETRNLDEVRAAILRWCRDVEQAHMQPEALLIQFKALLDGLEQSEQSPDVEERIRDRREMISMCIHEYYRQRD